MSLEKLQDNSEYVKGLIDNYFDIIGNGNPNDAQLMQIMTRFTQVVKYDESLYEIAYECMALKLGISIAEVKTKMKYTSTIK